MRIVTYVVVILGVLIAIPAWIGYMVDKRRKESAASGTIEEAASIRELRFDIFDDEIGRWWAVDDNNKTHGPFGSEREAAQFTSKYGRLK